MPVSDGVPALVASVREHKRFKQLAIYSIECVSKVICPPNSRWRENLQVAADCGGPQCVVEALKIHQGSDDSLLTCIECLTKMAVDPASADVIASEGAVDVLLQAIQNNPELNPEIIQKMMKLLQDLCGHPSALQKLVEQGVVKGILNALRARLDDMVVSTACVGVLDKLTRSAKGMDMFLQEGGIDTIVQTLGALARHGESELTSDAVLAATRLLTRSAKDQTAINMIKNASGIDCYLRILDNFKDDAIVRLSGKLLTRLMGDSVDELIQTIRAGTLSAAAQEHTLSLLASLAIDASTTDKIVQHGGIEALIRTFEMNASVRAIEAIAKAISRIALGGSHVSELVTAGTIDSLVRALQRSQLSGEATASVIQALARIAENPQYVSQVISAGGAQAVGDALARSMGSAQAAIAAAHFIAALSQANLSDIEQLVGTSAISGLLHAMRRNPDDPMLQAHGLKALIAMASSSSSVQSLLQHGAAELALNIMSRYKDNPDVLKESMFLTSSILLVPDGARRINAANGFGIVVAAVAANANNLAIREAAMELVELMSSEDLIRQRVGAMHNIARLVSSGKFEEEQMDALAQLALELATLSMIPTNVDKVIAAGGLVPMIQTLNAVAGMPNIAHHTEVLHNLLAAITELTASAGSMYNQEKDIVEACIRVINQHHKKTPAVIGAVKMLSSVTAVSDNHAMAMQAGIVEAVATALRSNLDSPHVLLHASQILLNLADDEGQAVQLCRLNATRQIINCIKQNAEKHDRITVEALKNMLLTLEAVASTKEGHNIVSKQGGVAAVFAAMEANSLDAEFVALCVRAINSLTSAQDVMEVLTRIQGFTADYLRSATPEQLAMISKEVERLGLLLMCGDFSELIQTAGGIETLQSIMINSQSAQPCRERNELLNNCIKAFGRAAVGNANVAGCLPIVPLLVSSIRDSPNIDGMRALIALCREPVLRSALIAAGACAVVLKVCETASSDKELLSASFQALAALSADRDGARAIVASDGLRFVCDYISETLYGSSLQSINDAVGVLSSLASSAHPTQLIQGGVTDVLNEILNTMLTQPASPSTLSAVVAIIGQMAADPATAEYMIKTDLPSKLVRLLQSRPEYLDDPELVASIARMVEILAQHPAGLALLNSMSTHELLLKAMNTHPNDVQLLKQVANTIGVLYGGQGLGLDGLIGQIDQTIAMLESAPSGPLLQQLSQIVNLVSNLMLLDGAIDQASADKLMLALSRAVAILRGQQVNDEQQAALAACLATLGKLATLKTVRIDTNMAVDLVQATMQDANQSNNVIKSACGALGNIAMTSEGIKTIASKGMIASVQRVAHQKTKVGVIATSNIGHEATTALEVITKQAISNAALLVGTEGGTQAIAEILKGISDARVLASTIAQILPIEGGLEALLQMLGEFAQSNEHAKIAVAIVKAMLVQRDATGLPAMFNNVDQVSAIVAASNLYPDAIVLLESAADSVFGGQLIAAAPGALQALLNALSSDNAATALAAIMMLAKLVSYNDDLINKQIIVDNVARSVVDSLKAKRSAEYVQNALYILTSLTQTIGVSAMNLTKEAMRIVQDVMYAFPDNEYIATAAAGFLAELSGAFAGATESLLEDRLRRVQATHSSAAYWQEVAADDGRTYFYNSATGETTWNQPTEHAVFVQELDAILHLVEALDGDMSEVEISTCVSVVNAISTHARDRKVLEKVLRIVAAQASDAAQAKLIAEQPRVADLVPAMQLHSDDVGLLSDAISILDSLSQFQKFREALSSLEYITVINNTILHHITVGTLVAKGLVTLGHIAFGNSTNIGFCMQVDVPRTCTLGMENHADATSAVEAAIYALTNLLFNSDENKLIITKSCIDQILSVGRRHLGGGAVYIKLLRLMGNLSLVDDAIMEMVKRKSVAMVVDGMRKHKDNEELLKTSMELLSNFGAIEDEELDSEVTAFIIAEKGIHAINECMIRHEESVPILTAGMEALYNIGNDEDAAEVLVELGIIELTLQVLEKYDYEQELNRQTMRFLAVAMYSETCVLKFGQLNGVQKLLQAIEARIDDVEFLGEAMQAVANAASFESNREQFLESNGVVTLLQLFELHSAEKELMQYSVQALTRLAANDILSSRVAERGMNLFMSLISQHIDDTNMLSLVFTLFGQLAFVKSNLKAMVQHGGIKVLLETMSVFEDDAILMIRTISTLDNVVSADEEYATIVMERGGRQAVEQVKNTHRFDSEVTASADSCLLSMNAMARVKDREGTKTNRGALFARLGDIVDVTAGRTQRTEEKEPEGDPLADHRNLLKAGQMLSEYSGGTGQVRHVMVSPDWDALLLKEVKSKTGAKGRRVPIRALRHAVAGAGSGHMKKGMIGGEKSAAAVEKAFHLTALRAEDEVFLEASSATDRDRWVAALDALIHVAKTWPTKLNI